MGSKALSACLRTDSVSKCKPSFPPWGHQRREHSVHSEVLSLLVTQKTLGGKSQVCLWLLHGDSSQPRLGAEGSLRALDAWSGFW